MNETMDFDSLYADYLNQLAHIVATAHELSEAGVKLRLRQVINYYFVWGHAVDADFPQKYGLVSSQVDQAVGELTRYFVEQTQQVAKTVALGDERNTLLENFDIETEDGFYFDEFIGSADTALADNAPVHDRQYGRYV